MNIHIGSLSGLPQQVQTVIFIGDRSCDHLRELIRIAEFKGRAAYRIEDVRELQPRWFVGVEEVGIVVGTTDLENIVRAVVERLNQFSSTNRKGMLEGVAK